MKSIRYSILLLLLVHPLYSTDIVVRSRLLPESVWVGQRVVLQIDVLGKQGWAQITHLNDLHIDGCYVLPAGNNRVRLQDRIDGADYSGQRYEQSIYPQRPGMLKLPQQALNLSVQTWGAHAGRSEHTAYTEALTIEAKLPAGLSHAHSFIAAPHFKARQTWSTEANEFTVGDALKRSIQLEAHELPAMLLPPVQTNHIQHLGIYADSPTLSDRNEGSTALAQRAQTITYLFESAGEVTIPDSQFQWWNTETATLTTITLKGKRIRISSGNVPPPPAAASSPTTKPATRLAIPLLLVVSALAAIVAEGFRRRRNKPSSPQALEKDLFMRITRAASQGSTTATVHAMIEWAQLLTQQQCTLSQFLESFAEPSTQQYAAELLRDPTARPSSIDPKSFLRGLRTARARYLKTRPEHARLSRADQTLPTLN